jgi:nucleoside-diphosphate-sugar epimerase
LVRSKQQATLLKAQFANVEFVLSTGNIREALVSEGKGADVVVQIANTDDEAMSFALLDGAAQHPGATYLHVSGIASLIDESITPGELDPKIYSDVNQIDELLQLPHDRLHAAIEQEIIARAEQSQTRVAILSLPRMFGRGQGNATPESKVIEPYLRGAQSRRNAFALGAGRNVSSRAHVRDASLALLLLVDEALKGESSEAQWGRNGYYFVEAGEGSFADFAQLVGQELYSQGVIPKTEVDSLDQEAAAKLWEWGPKFWGSNSRSRADRLRALGWRPTGVEEKDTIRDTIRYILGSG